MTKEPADWAKIKAYRAEYPEGVKTADVVLRQWGSFAKSIHELARMYDKYEQPPVDPDLLAARKIVKGFYPEMASDYSGRRVQIALAGIKHGRANP